MGSSENGRIAKNTLYLYIRMALIMLVSLYTSRVTLEVLGVEDYGLYNVIGGIVSFLGFFSSSLSNATQRYLNIGLANNNIKLTQQYFSQSVILYAIGIVVLIVFGETVGYWYVANKLVVPKGSESAAIWTYQFSLITILIVILQIPYSSAILAREKMSFYAYLGFFEVVLKLVVVFILKINHDSKQIVLYASLITVSYIIVFLINVLYCRKCFKECKLIFYWNKKLVKEMVRFISYNLYGCFAYSVGLQGNNIILNLFFGPVINAARAIAMQINAAVIRFSEAIMSAVKPQIIKNYSIGDYSNLIFLIFKSTVYTFIVMSVISLPIIINIDYILKLWLNDVPNYTSTFSILVIVEAMISVLSMPLWLGANATGKIKKNQLVGRTFMMLTAPVSFIILKIQPCPVIPFYSMICSQIAYWIYSFIDLKKQLNINIGLYIKEVVVQISIIFLCLLGIGYTERYYLTSDILCLVMNFISLLIAATILSFYITLSKSQRSLILKKLINKKN